MRSALGVVGLLAAAGFIWYALTLNTAPPTTSVDKEIRTQEYGWKLADLGESKAVPGMPITRVTLEAGGADYPIGDLDGNCSEVSESGWQLLENELSGVICWWAGGGREVGVFMDNDKAVVKVGILDEGSAEIPAFRGDFQTIFGL